MKNINTRRKFFRDFEDDYYGKEFKKITYEAFTKTFLDEDGQVSIKGYNEVNEGSNFVLQEKIITFHNNLKTYFDKYKGINDKTKTPLVLSYPDFHGSIYPTSEREPATFKKLNDNTIICFFTSLGNLGSVDTSDTQNLERFLKYLNINEIETILFNLANLCHVNIKEIDIVYESPYYNCFKNASWYYPGQEYPDLTIATDPEANKKYYSICRNNMVSHYIKNYPNNLEMKLSHFLETDEDKDMLKIYFFKLCRPFQIQQSLFKVDIVPSNNIFQK